MYNQYIVYFNHNVVHKPNNYHLSERITLLYSEINRLLSDTGLYINNVRDYININYLTLIQDDYNIGIETTLDLDTSLLSHHTDRLLHLDDAIINANTRRDILIEEVHRLEGQFNSHMGLNATEVFSSRSDFLNNAFDSLMVEYYNLFFNQNS
jgi:hypothetical protein